MTYTLTPYPLPSPHALYGYVIYPHPLPYILGALCPHRLPPPYHPQVSGAIAQRRGFLSSLFLRAAKLGASSGSGSPGGGSMSLMPVVPGRPATGIKTQVCVCVCVLWSGGGDSYRHQGPGVRLCMCRGHQGPGVRVCPPIVF